MSTHVKACAWMSRYVVMKQHLLSALLALLLFLPARAQLNFSDSLRISLLTCTQGPDAYERFGHAGLRIQDLRDPQLDVTFHYGVFSFKTPHFVYRFVKGETDYQLGALYTRDFIDEYGERGLGMTEQWLRLDSAQCQNMVQRLLINYLPENRTYRYSYFFDNCSTRPYHLLQASTQESIVYDTAWVNGITLRGMVQEKTGRGNWLDFGIALAVAGRADVPTTFEEELFLPDYLARAVSHAMIPVNVADTTVMLPLVDKSDTLLTMRQDVADQIAAPDPIRPATLLAAVLLLGLIVSAIDWNNHRRLLADSRGQRSFSWAVNTYDTVLLVATGLTGAIVWFLNFLSLHPAVDHNLNCLWLLPTHVIVAGLVWARGARKVCSIYFGITFALIILYVVMDWILGQYCPKEFLLLLATLLLRSYCRMALKR